ncbi:hypothetical protein [Alkalicoccus chagannorensis]|uniref:hypothetical protein n=1 Tax=Alkalicoccus chagannorensis TaxID=427072 RepID=UPI0003FC55C6|nr:hypothetical protein [Alkalicoccus chagannorensis]
MASAGVLIPAGVLLLAAGRRSSRPKQTVMALIGVIMAVTGWMLLGSYLLRFDPAWLEVVLRIVWIVLGLAGGIAMSEQVLRGEKVTET